MNVQSAELLQNSLQNLSSTFQRQRQLEAENAFRQHQLEEFRARTQLDDDYRREQLARTVDYQNKSLDRQDRLIQNESDKNANEGKRLSLEQSVAQFNQATQAMPEAFSNLRSATADLAQKVVDGDMTSDEADEQFKSAMDSQLGGSNPQLLQRLLSVPKFAAAYNGQADWGQMLSDIKAQNAQDAQAAAAKGPMNKFERTIKHTEIQATPAVKGQTHLFGPNDPDTPAVAGQPEWSEKAEIEVPWGSPAPAGFTPLTAADLNAQVQGATGGGPAAGITEGKTAINRATGQRIIFKSGAWQPLAAGGVSPEMPAVNLSPADAQQATAAAALHRQLLSGQLSNADYAAKYAQLMQMVSPPPAAQPIPGGGGFPISTPGQ